MKPSIIVWDLETVPDLGGFAAANDLVGKSDVGVREAIGDKFPKHIYHSIVCSESEIDIIHRAATPLPRWDQTLFMKQVAELLREEQEIGEGVVHRCVRVAQKQFWLPPRT